MDDAIGSEQPSEASSPTAEVRHSRISSLKCDRVDGSKNAEEPAASHDDTKSSSTSCHTSSSCSSCCSPPIKSHISTTSHRQRKYERKTKRFIWPDELHQLFVAAIFDVGLKNASPKALLTLMKSANPVVGLTTEHLKSHLQKYRLNYERSRQEFMRIYNGQNGDKHLNRLRKRLKKGSKWEHCPFHSLSATNESRKRHRMETFPPSDTSESNDNACHICKADSSPNWTDPSLVHEMVDSQSISLCSKPRENVEMDAKPVVCPHMKHKRSSHSSADGSHDLVREMGPVSQIPSSPRLGANTSGLNPLKSEEASQEVKSASSVDRISYADGEATKDSATVEADPQWTILSSLLSPSLAVSEGSGPLSDDIACESQVHDATASRGPANARIRHCTEKAETLLDPSFMEEDPTEVHNRIQLAMHAQMSLHRQMLLRKVAVSQQLSANDESRMRTLHKANVPSNASHDSVPWPPPNETTSKPISTSHPHYSSFRPAQTPNDMHAPFCALDSMDPIQNLNVSCPSSNTNALTTTLHAAPDTSQHTSTMEYNIASSFESSSLPRISVSDTNDDLLHIDSWSAIDLHVDLKEDDLFGFLKE